jgi:solute carrier family 25 S-adenosylmethionine transporter 26
LPHPRKLCLQVRCQTEGVRAMEVVRDISKGGVNVNLLKTLYAGAAGAALCSIFVGAAHYASYCFSRRTIMAQLHVEDRPGTAHSAHAGINTLPHHDPSDAQAVAAHAAATTAAAEAAQQQAKLRAVANISAAVIAALVTALVEAPTELFRHNAQAGLLKGSFMAEMVRVVRKQGPRALYWGFLPYCFEALPYDITELVVYGNMADTYDAAQEGKHKHSAAIRKVPQDAWDVATGAVAGTAAVLVSMPFDVIKTYMQTHSAEAMSKAGSGLWANTVLFAQTGRHLVQQKGWQAMFVGLSPRLAQQVPGAMVCWWAIEACRRTLEGPEGDEGSSEGSAKKKGH